MGIPLYPDLSDRIREATEYGPHVEMLQHLVFWFHPRHPQMQDRWELYKTRDEWAKRHPDGCVLGRRQVQKALSGLNRSAS
jgi:hypothetical protein